MMNDLKVRILGDDSDLQGKLRSSAGAVAKWGAAAVAAGAAATAALVKSGLESADALAKQAQQLNTTSKDLMTMQRAADMAGVSQEKLNSATRALTTRLAQAAAGTGTAGDAIDALGLSMDELNTMSLSDRVATINTALKENVSASESAAYAAQLYGEEAALALSKIDASALSTAAEEIDVFNAALSDIDAAKIENANDAMSRLGLAFDSVKMQSAAEFSGILNGIADSIFDAAKETDFFQTGISNAIDIGITGAGYLANAWRGVELAIGGLEVVLDGVVMAMSYNVATIVKMWNDATNSIAEAYNVVVRQANRLPGVDLGEIVVGESELSSRLSASADAAAKAYEESKQRLNDKFNEELPSDSLDRWVEEVRSKSQEAAEATVAARNATGTRTVSSTGEDVPSSTDLKALKEETQKRLDIINESLMSEAELREEARLNAFEVLEKAKGLDLATEQEYLEKEKALKDKYSAEDIARAKDRADKELAVEQALKQAKLGYASDTFGSLATLMSTENRKLFEIGKAAAIAQATVDGYAAVQKTMASVPYPFNIPLAAAQGIASAANISSIASTSFGGSSSNFSTATSGGSTSTSTNTSTAGGAAEVAAQQQVSIALSGDVYSRQSVTQLIEQINEAVSDGARIRVA